MTEGERGKMVDLEIGMGHEIDAVDTAEPSRRKQTANTGGARLRIS